MKPRRSSRPKRYHYTSNASKAFAMDEVEERGGHYVGCTTRISLTPDVVYAGYAGGIPLVVRNRKLKAFIINCLDGVGMNYAYHNFQSEIAHSPYVVNETVFVPIGERDMTGHRWSRHQKHLVHDPAFKDYAVVHVNNLTEDMKDCDLATLQPRVLDRMNRIVERYAKPKYAGNTYYMQARTRGWYYYNCNDYHPHGGKLPEEPAFDTVRTNLGKLGIPFDPNWETQFTIAKAKAALTK